MGCSDLGISMSNSSSSAPPPVLNEDSKNEGKVTTHNFMAKSVIQFIIRFLLNKILASLR
jgi:hypothetical protein